MPSKWGIPKYLNEDPQLREALTKGAELLYNNEEEKQRFIALEKTMLDILDDPVNFNRFDESPEAYLADIGFEGLSIDKNSQEYLVAKTVADPGIQKAIQNENVDEFLLALANSGVADQITTLRRELGQEGDDGLTLVFPVGLLAYVAAAVASWVAVSHTILLLVAVKQKVGVDSWIDAWTDIDTDVFGSDPLPPNPPSPDPPSPDPPSPNPPSPPPPDPPAPDPPDPIGPIPRGPWPEPPEPTPPEPTPPEPPVDPPEPTVPPPPPPEPPDPIDPLPPIPLG